MSTTTPDPTATIARELVATVTSDLGLDSRDLPAAARDAVRDYGLAIDDTIAASDQYQNDLAELNEKRDLLPAAGYARLRTEARTDAETKAKDADQAAARAYDTLAASLEAAAIPTLSPDREALARSELLVALQSHGTATGVTTRGSREAIAALFTTYGRTLLESRGVRGPELDRELKAARRIAALRGVEIGSGPGEIMASAALRGVGKLGAARGAAGAVVARRLRAE